MEPSSTWYKDVGNAYKKSTTALSKALAAAYLAEYDRQTTAAPPVVTPPVVVPPVDVPPVVTPPVSGFPTADSTGVPAGTVLKPWPSAWTSGDAIIGVPTETINGVAWKVVDGYDADFATLPRGYIETGSAPLLVRRCKVTNSKGPTDDGHGLFSNGTAIYFDRSELNGGNQYLRASYNAQTTIARGSKFVNCGNAALERSNGPLFDIQGCYITCDLGWPPGLHADGLQFGGGGPATIVGNTIDMVPASDAEMAAYIATNQWNFTKIANSCLGFWAETANETGPVTITGNQFIGGGGMVIYCQVKPPYTWVGLVKINGNVFVRKYPTTVPVAQRRGGTSGVMFPQGIPSQFQWDHNTWEDGSELTLAAAIVQH